MAETWSHSEGQRPNKVTVFERRPGGNLYVRVWDASLREGRGGWRKRSLKHKDRERAKTYAKEQAGKLAAGDEGLRSGQQTLARLFALYKRYRTPKKGEREQRADVRRIELWSRFLGGKKDPHRITRAEWERFIERRRSGAIDARGNPVSEEDRRPVRIRTIEVDLRFLLAVLRWGTTWGVGEGSNLLGLDAVPAYDIPTEKNPRRAVATQDRLERTMEVAADVHPYLPTLLALANGTGRRIGAIRQLQYSDLLADHGRHGHLRFRADSDKMGFDSTFPLTRELRRVVDRHVQAHPGIGDAPMFAASGDPSKPVTRYRVDRWLRVAERKAGLNPLPGKLWHAYRAKFATEMLDEPDRVVAALGGWKTPRTLDIYQQPDEGAMLRALERRRELREAKG